jgi:3-methyl-2-oxobutanoate hydroxymethyltransferase
MPVNIQKLSRWKQQGRAIVVLTAWDYAIAQLLDEVGVDIILVGDSMAMVSLGYKNTLPLAMQEMLYHAQSVVRGVKNALVVCDLPFLSYQQSITQAIESAGLLLKQAGVQAVKVEGGYPEMAETVRRLVQVGIPVMGHVGLTPQSVHQLGYRQQGKDEKDGDRILNEAVALEQAGAFAIVLEHIPPTLADRITQKLTIPTIGIGAGSGCDGQVLVTADLLGLSEKQPPFAKSYANLRQIITQAVQDYSEEVRNRQFPGI